MIGLIRNEHLKIFRRIATWVMIGLLLVTLIIAAAISKVYLSDPVDDNWKANLQQQNEDIRGSLDTSGSMPKAVRDTFKRDLAINEYRIEHDIQPLQTGSLWGFVNMTTEMTILIVLFTIIIAAGSVASEFSWGTIKLLLIRPVSRTKILLSKYISTFLFAIYLLLILFFTSLILGSLLFGIGDISYAHLVYDDGLVKERSMTLHIFSTYGFNSVDLLMMVTLSFMISAVFRSSSLAIGIAMFLMFAGSTVTMVLSQFEWAKYILFANTNLRQYTDGSPIVEGMTLGFSITMLLIYFVIFNFLSWWVFTKRDVSA